MKNHQGEYYPEKGRQRTGCRRTGGERTWAEIDLAALGENLRRIFRRSGIQAKRFLAVVKADAYGHGARLAAPAALAAGATELGVATIEEGEALRAEGITAPILSLSPIAPQAAPRAVAADLSVHLASRETAAALDEASRAAGRRTKVHVKIDAGMHRSGLALAEAGAFLEFLRTLPGIEVEGIYAHFASADGADRAIAYGTFGRFVELLRDLDARGLRPPVAHIANSAASLDMTETTLDMLRVGIALYGIYPSSFVSRLVSLAPVLAWRARLAEIRGIAAGEAVGYGETWRAPRATRIGLLTMGYADGYRRLLSNRGEVLLRGRRLPVVGRVSMDLTTIDLGDAAAAPGDEVTLLGEDAGERIRVEEIAEKCDTIPYEVTTGITARVPRCAR